MSHCNNVSRYNDPWSDSEGAVTRDEIVGRQSVNLAKFIVWSIKLWAVNLNPHKSADAAALNDASDS